MADKPENAKQVEQRLSVDIKREAPQSNPFLSISWIRSFIIGLSFRIFSVYGAIDRLLNKLFPDTSTGPSLLRWGSIFVGPKNPQSQASGPIVATGTLGASIPISQTLSANGLTYTVTTGGSVVNVVLSVVSITRVGTTATVTTNGNHNLSSFVPASISGADQPEYNVVDADIMVTSATTFCYEVSGAPATPATGTITTSSNYALLQVQSNEFGVDVNLGLDSPLTFSTTLAGIDNTAYANFSEVGGGVGPESDIDYQARYLDKIRNPVASYSANTIKATAKTVAGVTRVFVYEANDTISTINVSSITLNGNVATLTTATDHNLESGATIDVFGADQNPYNVANAKVIVESSTVLHYIVIGSPVSPATGIITTTGKVGLGRSLTYFMRDNDAISIPAQSEIDKVKDKIDEIRPANTASVDNVVSAPIPVTQDFVFTSIEPDTPTMRTSISARLDQFFSEEVELGLDVTEDAYRCAINSTIDSGTGEKLKQFVLSAPVGPIALEFDEIAIKGDVNF